MKTAPRSSSKDRLSEVSTMKCVIMMSVNVKTNRRGPFGLYQPSSYMCVKKVFKENACWIHNRCVRKYVSLSFSHLSLAANVLLSLKMCALLCVIFKTS